MIRKYIYGNPYETEAVIRSFSPEDNAPAHGDISAADGFTFTYTMDEKDIVYGLGEAN